MCGVGYSRLGAPCVEEAAQLVDGLELGVAGN